MKNRVKLIIGYLLLMPAVVYWVSEAVGIDIMKLIEGPPDPKRFETPLGFIVPFAIALMVFPLISGLFGVSVYKWKDQCKWPGLLLTIISIMTMMLTLVFSFGTATFVDILIFYILGGLSGMYVYKRRV